MIGDFETWMYNAINMTTYDDPYLPQSAGHEWLKVTRTGPILTVADASGDLDTPEPQRRLGHRMHGVFLFARQDCEVFLLTRELHPSEPQDNIHFPVDGTALIQRDASGLLHLQAGGRHDHTSHVPPGGKRGWLFDASEVRK